LVAYVYPNPVFAYFILIYTMEIRLLETFVPAGQRLLQEKPIERPPSPNIYSHPEKPQERKTEKLLAAEMYAVIVGAELPNYEQDIYQEQLDMAIVNVNPGSESTCDTIITRLGYGGTACTTFVGKNDACAVYE
jgi:hypothetical protein